MKIKATNLILLGALLVTPFVFSSCARPVAAGVAGAAVYDHNQDEKKKEDYAKAKGEQIERKKDRADR